MPSGTREALEAALAARFGDAALHAAYADFLMEQGDPRGEFIRLQLDLEDPNLPAARRIERNDRADELHEAHEAEWLGPLLMFVRGPEAPVRVKWVRGWVVAAETDRVTGRLAEALVAAPALQQLRRLWVAQMKSPSSRVGTTDEGFGAFRSAAWLPALRRFTYGPLGSPVPRPGEWAPAGLPVFVRSAVRLRHLRVAGNFAPALPRLLPATPRLRSLTVIDAGRIPLALLANNKNLAGLHSLHLDNSFRFDGDESYSRGRENSPDELGMLFASPYLQKLEYLTLRLHHIGDVLIDELAKSGFVARLKGLDLQRCDLTDDGAEALARCPGIGQLEYLRLAGNHLSPVGLAALEDAGQRHVGRQAFGPRRWREL